MKLFYIKSRYDGNKIIKKYKLLGVTLYKRTINSNREKSYSIQDALHKKYRILHPLNIKHVDSQSNCYRLNVVLDTIDERYMLGGCGTSVILAVLFCYKENIALRIITRFHKENKESFNKFVSLMRLPKLDNVEFYSDYDRDEFGKSTNKLFIHNKDLFMATSWWNAYSIKVTGLSNFYYLIQEDETLFYPNGSLRCFCTDIFNDSNIRFIVNSKILYENFALHYKNIVKNGQFFHPAFPTFLYKKINTKKEKRKLFFYSRPYNERNLYDVGILALDYAIKKNIINTESWDIFFAGSQADEFYFSNGYKPIFLGQMGWKEYSSFLSDVDVTFCLIYTPHPAYVNLDTLASGGIAVTNQYENKKDIDISGNFIIAPLTINGLADGLDKGIKLSLNPKLRKYNYDNQLVETNWEHALSNCINFMRDNIPHCLKNGK